jgi:transcriptional regulator with XRE-family HTH domain
MDKKLRIYLRTYRLRSGLSQGEVAFLVGLQGSSPLSKLELSVREPSRTKVAFTLATLFGVPLRDLFPAYHRELSEDLGTKAYQLHSKLEGNPSKTTAAKLDFLGDVIRRAQNDGGEPSPP